MIRTIIVDDEPAIAALTRAYLEQHSDICITGVCHSLEEARQLLRNTHPDLLLLDIDLGDGNGFELLQSLERTDFHLIFITAHNDFALRAIKFGALDYLLKPLDEGELAEALDKVRRAPGKSLLQEQLRVSRQEFSSPEPSARIVLRSQHYLRIVELHQILYCRSDKGYTTFFFTDGQKQVVSGTIREYEELLPSHLFIRCHQSYLVHYRYVDRYHKEGSLVLRNGTEIPVSVRRKDYVWAFLTKHSC